MSFDDAHASDTGSWTNDGGGTWTGTDYVDGTLTVSIDEQVANGTTVQASSPLIVISRNFNT